MEARLSRGHRIWLLAHPFPTSPNSKLDRRQTERLRKRDKLLTEEEGMGWARSQIVRPQESLGLYKSSNTLLCSGDIEYVDVCQRVHSTLTRHSLICSVSS
jgi:hypothetical protein